MKDKNFSAKELKIQLEDSKEILNTFLSLPQKVQELLIVVLQNNLPTYGCLNVYPHIFKSPIEFIYITAFDIYCTNKESIILFPQPEIRIENKKYFADFLFDLSYSIKDDKNKSLYKNKNYKLVIECDGHEFHHKTKEQVENDNKREYSLKMAGYDVLRFSGTEIYNDPFECAEKTYDYIMKKIQEE